MRHFAGRVAVVTGAAGGLGRALAGQAAALGMRLVLADLDADALERASGELQAGGSEVLALVCDVGKPSHVEELADAALVRFHGVHLLFNHAGPAPEGPVWTHAEADWERVLGTNLWGAIHGVRVFAPLMLDCARRDPGYEGRIVNSAAPPGPGTPGDPGRGMAGVPAYAVVALTETLYHDLRRAHTALAASVLYADEEHPGEAARAVFDAIRRGDFAIFAQPRLQRQATAALAARLDALAHGKPPPDAARDGGGLP